MIEAGRFPLKSRAVELADYFSIQALCGSATIFSSSRRLLISNSSDYVRFSSIFCLAILAVSS